jgi:hypothetical protein
MLLVLLLKLMPLLLVLLLRMPLQVLHLLLPKSPHSLP